MLARSVLSPEKSPVPLSGTDVLARLHESLSSSQYTLPVPPSVALELLALTRSPDVDPEHVVALMERDALVAAKVLAVSQSAYFRRSAHINSLREAVVRLGTTELSLLFLEITAQVRIFRAPGFGSYMATLRAHSIATASIARLICARASVHEGYAFMCGLLHDVGIAIAASAVASSSPAILAWPGILEAHEEAGRVLGAAWNLPPELTTILGDHHSLAAGGYPHPVACVVAVADSIASELGFGIAGEPQHPEPDTELTLLGLDETDIETVRTQARELCARHA
jgi:HD-like signal output (HDOD) protein